MLGGVGVGEAGFTCGVSEGIVVRGGVAAEGDGIAIGLQGSLERLSPGEEVLGGWIGGFFLER